MFTRAWTKYFCNSKIWVWRVIFQTQWKPSLIICNFWVIRILRIFIGKVMLKSRFHSHDRFIFFQWVDIDQVEKYVNVSDDVFNLEEEKMFLTLIELRLGVLLFWEKCAAYAFVKGSLYVKGWGCQNQTFSPKNKRKEC